MYAIKILKFIETFSLLRGKLLSQMMQNNDCKALFKNKEAFMLRYIDEC